MIRMRRSAPALLVFGTLLLALSTGTVALAQVAASARADAGVTALVIDRLAYLVIANLTVWALALVAMWRWSGSRLAEANGKAIEAHNQDEDAHGPAAHKNHEGLFVAMHNLDLGMADVIGRLNVIAETVKIDARLLGDINDRLATIEDEHARMMGPRDPKASPHPCRNSDPPGFDGTPRRGRS